MMTDDTRQHSPAAVRNKEPILAVLRRLLPPRGRALEIASGSGQHAAHFAAGLPGWSWQPTDAEPAALASIAAWQAHAQLPNLLVPLHLDVLAPLWLDDDAVFDLVYCANMLHIAPWAVCPALLRGAARCLAPHGRLVIYGPFFIAGQPVAPGNLAFDAELRARNPLWGVRRLADVAAAAREFALVLREQVEMPANNLTLVFEHSRENLPHVAD